MREDEIIVPKMYIDMECVNSFLALLRQKLDAVNSKVPGLEPISTNDETDISLKCGLRILWAIDHFAVAYGINFIEYCATFACINVIYSRHINIRGSEPDQRQDSSCQFVAESPAEDVQGESRSCLRCGGRGR